MHSGQIGVESELFRVELDGFGVLGDGVREVFALVERVAFQLLRFSVSLALQCLLLFIRQGCLCLGLALGLLFFGPLLLFSLALRSDFCSLLLSFGLLLAHRTQVNASKFFKDFHEARVHLHHLDQHLWVHHAHIEHVLELHVLEICRELWISLESLQLLLRERTVRSPQSTHSTSRHSHAWHAAHTWHTAHAWHASHRRGSFLHLGLVTQLLALSVARVFLHANVVLLDRLVKLALRLQDHRLSLVPL